VLLLTLAGEVRRVEVKALVSKDKGLPDFGLGPINLRSLGDATGELLAELYKTFRGLLENDAVNYRLENGHTFKLVDARLAFCLFVWLLLTRLCILYDVKLSAFCLTGRMAGRIIGSASCASRSR